MNVLFYSNRCSHCQRLFAEFGLLQQPNSGITLIDIDTNTQNIPPYLQVVPTLILEGAEKYEGKDVFNALRARLAPMQRTTASQSQQPPTTQTVEPYAFSCSNVTNKGFSFIDTDHPVYSEQANYAFFT